MLILSIPILVSLHLISTTYAESSIIDTDAVKWKRMRPFWANTGFCPPAPTNDSEALHAFFGSADVRWSINAIAALPVSGRSMTVRVHWLFNLIEIRKSGINRTAMEYDFSKLDQFMDMLNDVHLRPVLEFMGNPSGIFNSSENPSASWYDLVYRTLKHYIDRYGKSKVSRWIFESWNEPDLQGYNVLVFSLKDYRNYLTAVKRALVDSFDGAPVRLRGPAGLFKSVERHPLCWGILDECNANQSTCPLDDITFHRKGNGSANSVVDGGIGLVDEMFGMFPNLQQMSYSNSEADPTSGWSKPLHANSNVQYAVTLIHIVLGHWTAVRERKLPQLRDISHDNSFLSYHPFEFEQRTLLARFSMNLTHPPEVQFIKKPAFAAFGLLGRLAEQAGPVVVGRQGALSLITRGLDNDEPYIAILLASSETLQYNQGPDESDHRRTISVRLNRIKDVPIGSSLIWFAEYVEQNVTDPNHEWVQQGRPPFPNADVRQRMRYNEGPHILVPPQPVNTTFNPDTPASIELTILLNHPWIVLIRICSRLNGASDSTYRGGHIHGLRVLPINQREVMLFWNLRKAEFKQNRCIKTFELFHRSNGSTRWHHINRDRHNPFMLFHYAPVNMAKSVSGDYKVRSVDMFDRRSSFSKVFSYFL